MTIGTFQFSQGEADSAYCKLLEKVSRTLELEPMLGFIGQAVVDAGLADGLAILLKDPDEALLRYELIKLPEDLANISRAYFKLGVDIGGNEESAIAYREDRAIVLNAATLSAAHEDTQTRFVRWRMHSLIVLPFHHEGSAVGTILAYRTSQPIGDSEGRAIAQLIEALSTQILNSAAHSRLTAKVLAIESASLERTRFLEFISELNNLTASEQIFQMIADEFLRRYAFDLAFFDMIAGDYLYPQCFRAGSAEVDERDVTALRSDALFVGESAVGRQVKHLARAQVELGGVDFAGDAHQPVGRVRVDRAFWTIRQNVVRRVNVTTAVLG